MANKAPRTEICLYGVQACGHGFLARVEGGEGLLGDASPVAGRSLTETLALAKDALCAAGATRKSPVAVFAPGGLFLAETTLGELRWYGDLRFRALPIDGDIRLRPE